MICKTSKILGGLFALSTLLTLPAWLPAWLPGSLASDYSSLLFANALASDSSGIADIESERSFPITGMSSSAVAEQFGEPVSRSNPVGNPPISMWKYDAFNVYFERKLVITTVADDGRLPEKLKEIQ